jgi:hypothetical protein
VRRPRVLRRRSPRPRPVVSRLRGRAGRRCLAAPAALAVIVVGGLVAAGSGSAQAPGARTLSLFETDTGSRFAFVDNAPKSPVRNPESRRFRFSLGDEIVFVNPLLDRRGGSPAGTLYGHATVVGGRTFANLLLQGQVTLALADGSQIAAAGTFSPGKTARVSIVGGTGAYEGARGTVVSEEVQGGSQDTLTILP